MIIMWNYHNDVSMDWMLISGLTKKTYNVYCVHSSFLTNSILIISLIKIWILITTAVLGLLCLASQGESIQLSFDLKILNICTCVFQLIESFPTIIWMILVFEEKKTKNDLDFLVHVFVDCVCWSEREKWKNQSDDWIEYEYEEGLNRQGHI